MNILVTSAHQCNKVIGAIELHHEKMVSNHPAPLRVGAAGAVDAAVTTFLMARRGGGNGVWLCTARSVNFWPVVGGGVAKNSPGGVPLWFPPGFMMPPTTPTAYLSGRRPDGRPTRQLFFLSFIFY